jgi:hypothetical protein
MPADVLPFLGPFEPWANVKRELASGQQSMHFRGVRSATVQPKVHRVSRSLRRLNSHTRYIHRLDAQLMRG